MKSNPFSPRRRLSPRERFVSVLRGGTLPGPPAAPWFLQRGNLYVLLVLLVVLICYGILQATYRTELSASPHSPGGYSNTSSLPDSPDSRPDAEPDPETMEYEEAKRIFNESR
ncbi:MAG TPA: hypothetical protein PLH79_18475 [bacterium]|nr:hypothetical protein [bacterium]HPP03015.1 hypothetical protein [bacterium]HXK94465.1 hypothetical protein [bacterium]